MRQKYNRHSLTFLTSLLAILLFAADEAIAHCDTMDGPVVKAAQTALATRNVNLVLIWVQNVSLMHYLDHLYEEKGGLLEQ
ncbi:MAG TPA: hypothetical protein DHU55_11780 [Blastocatellia bacterium]|jgi:hypothetical protein|nr:hypothetical protein [Blastocatellia bacterium]HCX30427.1 hypothetical protein [Blastocatellia bacterium]